MIPWSAYAAILEPRQHQLILESFKYTGSSAGLCSSPNLGFLLHATLLRAYLSKFPKSMSRNCFHEFLLLLLVTTLPFTLANTRCIRPAPNPLPSIEDCEMIIDALTVQVERGDQPKHFAVVPRPGSQEIHLPHDIRTVNPGSCVLRIDANPAVHGITDEVTSVGAITDKAISVLEDCLDPSFAARPRPPTVGFDTIEPSNWLRIWLRWRPPGLISGDEAKGWTLVGPATGGNVSEVFHAITATIL